MKILMLIPPLALCGIVAACAKPASAPTPLQVAKIFRELDGPERPGCSVGVTREGTLIHASAYGASDLGAGVPLETRTVYNVGSISKQFTAFAVLMLEQEGKLSLDDPVRKYVTELDDYADGVTLRHLLHHIGGLRDYVALLLLEGHRFTERATREQALEVLGRQSAANALPATEYDYSNTGYFLLGVVVERVSGRSLAQFSRDNIFVPLRMADTTLVDRYPADVARLARGYARDGNGFTIDEPLWEQAGDGQVHTTVEDLARWEGNLLTGRVGGKDLVRRMLQPARLRSGARVNYGAGLVLGEYRGLQTVRHGGDWGGYSAHFFRFPQQRFAAIVLCNRSDVEPSQYTAALADLYLADSLQPANVPSQVRSLRAVGRGTDPARMPAGLYRNRSTASHLRLVTDGSVSRLELGGMSSSVVEVEPGVFQLPELGDSYAVFAPGGAGETARVFLRDSPQTYVFEPAQQWQPESLGPYMGNYESAEVAARFAIVARDGRLVLETGAKQLPLEPMTRDEFIGEGLPDEGDRFTLRFSAQADELRYFSDGLRGLRFERS